MEKRVMTLVCKEEPLDDLGNKLFRFTKGNQYVFTQIAKDQWDARDDRGHVVEFCDPFIMFEKKISPNS